MRKISKTQMMELLTLIVVIGVMLFISLNTAEAKKLVGYVMTVLTPFIYGFCIAFILNLVAKPFDRALVRHAEKKNKPVKAKTYRLWSIILSILVVVLFAGLTIGMIIPNLKNTVVSLYKQAPVLWEKLFDFLDSLKVKQPKLATYITSLENSMETLFEKATASLKTNLSSIASTAMSKIKSASNVLLNFGLGLIIAFAALMQKEVLLREIRVLLKRTLSATAFRRTEYVLKLANKKFQIYFKYNLIQALITGAGTFVMMLVSGMPYKVSITLLITVTQLIPIVGAIAGTTVSALLIAAVSPVRAVLFVVLSIVVQQVVEKLINPHLMGKELEMPGILTFLAIVIGGKQFGLAGLICAVPFVSVCYDIYTQKLRPRIYENIKEDIVKDEE